VGKGATSTLNGGGSCILTGPQQLAAALAALASRADPKMQRLEAELLAHFSKGCGAEKAPGAGSAGAAAAPAVTRAIVFTTLRSSVTGIVEAVSRHAPLIRARWVLRGQRST
jgi:ERCC4-related helicase